MFQDVFEIIINCLEKQSVIRKQEGQEGLVGVDEVRLVQCGLWPYLNPAGEVTLNPHAQEVVWWYFGDGTACDRVMATEGVCSLGEATRSIGSSVGAPC